MITKEAQLQAIEGREPGSNDATRAQLMFERLMEIARASALEEMASGFAHELNQPLGAIATFAQAGERMLNRPAPMIAPATDVFKQITSAALGAGEGIRRIRKLFNRDTPNKVQCSLPELLEELQPLLEALAHRAKGNLEVVVASEVPQVHADRLRIQHVLFTLVQNAFEASMDQANGAVARVRIKVHGDRYTVSVDVEDSGSGIPSEASEHIFKPFFTTKPQGTGLALAASRAIIEAHDGTIGFEAASGGGTRFWFRLPAVVESKI